MKVNGWMRYSCGVFFLLCVVFIWVGASVLMQTVFEDMEFNKPFFFTYVATSSFSMYLVVALVKYLINKIRHKPELNQGYELQNEDDVNQSDIEVPKNEGGEAMDKLTHYQTARLSLEFCIIWFLANYSTNSSLQFTSVTSSTILSSTSGFFTLIIGAFFMVEVITFTKFVAVCVSLSGVVLVSISDKDGDGGNESLVGDLIGLFGAVMYGCYIVLLKKRIKHEERVDMHIFFGFVGLFNIFLLWPFFLILHYTGVEPFELPSKTVAGLMALNTFVGTFLSDYLWLLAMLMTSPVVVTLGLSLTIPLAVISDLIQGKFEPTSVYWIGTLLVLSGFFLVNFGTLSSKIDDWVSQKLSTLFSRKKPIPSTSVYVNQIEIDDDEEGSDGNL